MNVNIILLVFILVLIIAFLLDRMCFFYNLLLSNKNDINFIKDKLSKHINTISHSSDIVNCIIPYINNSIKEIHDLHIADVNVIKQSLEDLNGIIDDLRTKDKNDIDEIKKIENDLNQSIIILKKSIETLSTSYISDINEIRQIVNISVDKLTNLNATSINDIKNKLQDSINTITKIEDTKSETSSQGIQAIENYDNESMLCLGGTCFKETDLLLFMIKSTEVPQSLIIDEINKLKDSIAVIKDSMKNIIDTSLTKDDLKSGKIDMNINDINLRKLQISDWNIYRDNDENNLCISNITKDDKIICMDNNLNATMTKT